jgi:hypothetical protein
MTSADRVDLFGFVHKGLRAQLFWAAGLVARTDFGDELEGAAAVGALERLLGLLAEHALHEDTNIMPLVSGADPHLWGALSRDHAQLEAIQHELVLLLGELRRRPPAERAPLGPDIVSLVNGLVAEHLLHMEREQHEANAVLWSRYPDQVLALARARIFESVPPERYLEWMQIVLPALNAPERRALLAALEAILPAASFVRLAAAA